MLSGLMTMVVILSTSVFAIMFKDSIGPGAAGLTISFALNMTGMFLFAIQGAADVETNIVSGERILEYTRIESEVRPF